MRCRIQFLAQSTWLSLFIPLCLWSQSLRGDEVIPANPEPRWWKGNIHTHTFWSDGGDFPEMVAEWYRTQDYNFLALSDHNILSEGIRWVPYSRVEERGGKDCLPKYLNRFGSDWVETRGEEGTPNYEVRLKPLSEFRALVEQRGQFIMIPGEEITDRVEDLAVHLNATNIKQVIQPLGGQTVVEAIQANLRAVAEQAERTGQEMIVHLNHPNLRFSVTAEDLAHVVAERFFEVYNGHPGVSHTGDQHHPHVERLWDIANTIRLAQLDAPPLFGVATDDSHTYDGRPGSHPGRGWIMVRCRHLTPESLIRAIRDGDFYGSSGVTLSEVHFDADNNTLRLSIQPHDGASYTTNFVGTTVDYDSTSEPRTDETGKPVRGTRKYSADVGRVLATVTGTRPSYQLTGKELYVRAEVNSSLPHPDPSFDNQHQQAWTQPVGWRKRFEKPE